MQSAERYVELAEEMIEAGVFNCAAVYAALAAVAQAKEEADGSEDG